MPNAYTVGVGRREGNEMIIALGILIWILALIAALSRAA